MLSKSAIDLAFPTADALAKRNVILAGPGEDPITELANISLADLPVALNSNPNLSADDVVSSIYEASKRQDPSLNGLNGCRHDIVMEELRKNIAATVKATIKTARDVAIPLINDCAEAAKQLLNEQAKAELYPFSVESYHVADFAKSPVLMEMTNNFRDSSPNEVSLISLPVAELDTENLLVSLMNASSTGIERFDAELHDWLSKNLERAAGLYNTLFHATGSFYSALNLMAYDAVENAAFMYLLARKHFENGPSEGLDMDLNAWRAYVSGLMAAAGATLHQIHGRLGREVQSKRLVLRSPQDGASAGKFIVNGALLEGWSNAGGDVESIMGSHFKNRDYGYESLISNKDQNVDEWNRQYRIYTSVSASNISTQSQKAMYDAIQPRIAAQFPDHVTSARLYDLCQTVKPEEAAEMYVAIRRVVCGAVFENTDVLHMLELYDAAATENPDADNRTIALIAVTRYVGRWIAQLVSPHTSA